MQRLLVLAIFLLSTSGLFAEVIPVNSEKVNNDTIQVSGTLNYSYKGESFITIFSAWQDIKIHSLDLLQLISQNDIDTAIYPAGEVYELDKDKYSTGYIFVKKLSTPTGAKIFNIQFDMVVVKEKITINYTIISNKNMDYGLSQQELNKMKERYQKNMESLNNSFISYFLGMKRLAREYHGIIIEE